METDQTFTVGQVAAALGEKPRTVQFWTDAGVLRPVAGTARGGKGTHRRYPHGEFLIAKLASRLARMNSPIGEIIDVTRSIREFKDFGPDNAYGRLIEELTWKTENAEKEGGLVGVSFFNFLLYIANWWVIKADWTLGTYILIVYSEGEDLEAREVFLWVNDARWTSLWGSLGEFVGYNFPSHMGFKLIRADSIELREIIFGPDAVAGKGSTPEEAILGAAEALSRFLDLLITGAPDSLPDVYVDLKNSADAILGAE